MSQLPIKLPTLDQLPQGVVARVCHVDDALDGAAALRRLGIREGAAVEILGGSDPVMVRCEGSCVALGRCMLTGISIFECSEPRVCPHCASRDAGSGRRFLGGLRKILHKHREPAQPCIYCNASQ